MLMLELALPMACLAAIALNLITRLIQSTRVRLIGGRPYGRGRRWPPEVDFWWVVIKILVVGLAVGIIIPLTPLVLPIL